MSMQVKQLRRKIYDLQVIMNNYGIPSERVKTLWDFILSRYSGPLLSTYRLEDTVVLRSYLSYLRLTLVQYVLEENLVD